MPDFPSAKNKPSSAQPVKQGPAPSKANANLFDIRILAIGLIGLVCVGIWAAGYVILGYDEWIKNPALGLTGRVGFLLTVLWLAIPTLRPLLKFRSSLIWGILIILAAFLIFRPRLMPIVIGVIVVGSTVNWVLKIFANASKPD